MSRLYVLVGMIASGKSTYAKNMARRGAIVINDDAIVQAVHGGDYGMYSSHLKHLYKGVESAIAHLANGREIVVDIGRNVSKLPRRRWLAAAKSLDYTCVAVVFPIENALVHARRRFQSDGRGYSLEYWHNVAMHHSDIYSAPSREEGFDEIMEVTRE